MGLKVNDKNLLVENANLTNKKEMNTNASNSIFEYKVEFNGVIDHFEQGHTSDCWLLAELSSLSHKSWGEKVIKEAIKSDGMGGVIVTFKGAKGNQKEFRISADEIYTIRKNQNERIDTSKYDTLSEVDRFLAIKEERDYKLQYSKGDDDVLVLELAIEKYLKTQGEETIDAFKMRDPKIQVKNIVVELLTGSSTYFYLFAKPTKESPIAFDFIKQLDLIEKEPDSYVTTVTFERNEIGLRTSHCYEVKNIKNEKCGHKIVTLINPYNNSKEIKVDYYTFINALGDLRCSGLTEVVGNREFYTTTYKRFNEELSKYEFNSDHQNCQENFEKEQIYSRFLDIMKMENKEKRSAQIRNLSFCSEYKGNSEKMVKLYYYLYELCEQMITEMDKAEWGWGRGSDKKELMMPFIDTIAQMAKIYVSEEEILTFKRVCTMELDAIFYTNEKKIINACKNILEKICMQRNETFERTKLYVEY